MLCPPFFRKNHWRKDWNYKSTIFWQCQKWISRNLFICISVDYIHDSLLFESRRRYERQSFDCLPR